MGLGSLEELDVEAELDIVGEGCAAPDPLLRTGEGALEEAEEAAALEVGGIQGAWSVGATHRVRVCVMSTTTVVVAVLGKKRSKRSRWSCLGMRLAKVVWRRVKRSGRVSILTITSENQEPALGVAGQLLEKRVWLEGEVDGGQDGEGKSNGGDFWTISPCSGGER